MTKASVLRKDYTPSAWRIPRIDLQFELDPTCTRVTTTLHIECALQGKEPALILDGDGLQHISVAINGQILPASEYTLLSRLLIIPYPGEQVTITTVVQITPQNNTQLEGLYVCGSSLTTQCEAQGFRRITWMLDRPDVMSIYETTLIADPQRYPTLLSNGNPKESHLLDDGRLAVTWHDPFPKPCYLFACVAGRFATLESTYTTGNGRSVRLAIYSEPHHLERLQHAMDSLKRAMAWDEKIYDREYDLDHYLIYCADDFNMGAMENKGLNVFNTKCVVASPETATDDDYVNVERVIAHEYFHNWTGNRITCRDWFQLSFKEGWTVFREAGFAEDMGDAGLVRLQDVDFLKVHQFPEDAGPHAHPIQPDQYLEIDNFYTTTIYEKGAEVIRMLAQLMGFERYQQACNTFFARFDGQAVTCQDFLGVMKEYADLDMEQFEHWYHQAGTPHLTVEPRWNPETKTYTLTFKQRTYPTPDQPRKEPMIIPVQMELLNQQGEPIPLYLDNNSTQPIKEHCIVVNQAEQQVIFYHIQEAPIPALLKGFSAPIHLECSLSTDQWLHLAQHTADACVRDHAIKTVLRHLVETRLSDNTTVLEDAWLDTVGTWLDPKRAFKEPGIIAHLLTLPAVSTLADFAIPIYPTAVITLRETLENRVNSLYQEELKQLYLAAQAKCHTLDMHPYDFSAEASGLRALRNRILAYLNVIPHAYSRQLAFEQYEQARCLTDRVGALSALNRYGSHERTTALEDFKHRYQSEALVLDKAWILEASCPEPEAFERVKTIWSSTTFDQRNPNRVRSLLYTFGHQNWRVFHHEEGHAYHFMGSILKDLDRSNPNLAARLITVFARWNSFGHPWKERQRDVLSTIQSTAQSANLRELTGKYLNASTIAR